MNYTLVVIDMQETFIAYLNAKVEAAKAIRQAVEDKADIVFLEYLGFNSTIKELTKLTDGYERVKTITKNSCGGGKEVVDALEEMNFTKDNIKICGVNTDQCVLETVKGIANLLPATKLHILEKACSAVHDHSYGIRTMKMHSPQINIT